MCSQRSLFLVCLLGLLSSTIFARIVPKDEFINTLRQHGIPEHQIKAWACIAYRGSRYDTAAYNALTHDHGILQISQLYWCSPNGQGCDMTCDSLRDNDINNDIECAKIVYKEHQRLYGDGFQAWPVHYKHCV